MAGPGQERCEWGLPWRFGSWRWRVGSAAGLYSDAGSRDVAGARGGGAGAPDHDIDDVAFTIAVLTVMVRHSSSAGEAETGFESMRSTYAGTVGVTDVPDVGDQAFWMSSPRASYC